MKLLRFGESGKEQPGILHADGTIRDLSGIVPDIGGGTLLPDSIARLRSLDGNTLPKVSGSPRLGPCVSGVGKFICVGLNYSDHAAESNMPVPAEPIIFMKATSSICGPNDDVELPRGSLKSDWEVELGVVIGKPAKYVAEADALSHVAGFCVVNDLSERAYQLEGTGQWVKGKSADTFGPIGPWLVTTDEIPDPSKLMLQTRLNGQEMQKSGTDLLIYDIPTIIEFCSKWTQLSPGDVIATGTPEGIGGKRNPPVWMKHGDVLEVEISGIGTLRSHIIDEK